MVYSASGFGYRNYLKNSSFESEVLTDELSQLSTDLQKRIENSLVLSDYSQSYKQLWDKAEVLLKDLESKKESFMKESEKFQLASQESSRLVRLISSVVYRILSCFFDFEGQASALILKIDESKLKINQVLLDFPLTIKKIGKASVAIIGENKRQVKKDVPIRADIQRKGDNLSLTGVVDFTICAYEQDQDNNSSISVYQTWNRIFSESRGLSEKIKQRGAWIPFKESDFRPKALGKDDALIDCALEVKINHLRITGDIDKSSYRYVRQMQLADLEQMLKVVNSLRVHTNKMRLKKEPKMPPIDRISFFSESGEIQRSLGELGFESYDSLFKRPRSRNNDVFYQFPFLVKTDGWESITELQGSVSIDAFWPETFQHNLKRYECKNATPILLERELNAYKAQSSVSNSVISPKGSSSFSSVLGSQFLIDSSKMQDSSREGFEYRDELFEPGAADAYEDGETNEEGIKRAYANFGSNRPISPRSQEILSQKAIQDRYLGLSCDNLKSSLSEQARSFEDPLAQNRKDIALPYEAATSSPGNGPLQESVQLGVSYCLVDNEEEKEQAI